MTTTEKAKAIRKALKALGINSRMVSVKSRHGCSIHVTLKDVTVEISKVQEIADGHENIRRDEYTGDILRGGNTFVTVEWDRKVIKSLASTIEPQLSDKEGKVVTIEGVRVWKSGPYDYRFDADHLDGRGIAYGRHNAAESVARQLLAQ